MKASANPVEALRSTLTSYQQLPLAQVRGLPAFCYTTPEVFAFETEHLLRSEWLCLGWAVYNQPNTKIGLLQA